MIFGIPIAAFEGLLCARHSGRHSEKQDEDKQSHHLLGVCTVARERDNKEPN